MSRPSAVVLDDVSFHWPDGAPALVGLSGALTRARTGLVGANGAGKSTLLRLISGELRPTSGSLTTVGRVDHLRQDAARAAGTVAGLLGLDDVRTALRAVEAGSVDPVHFDTIGDAWDVEERAVAELAAVELPTDLDRPVVTLSGGEAMLVALTGIRVRGAEIALLDEPTNNLDIEGRDRLHELVRTWRGTLVVASHDRELLDLLDETAELREGTLTTFGGPYAAYRASRDALEEAALRDLRAAEQVLRRAQRERAKAEERIAHSVRQGRKDRADRAYVPAVLNDRRNGAEKAQGSRRTAALARVDAARTAVETADRALRRDDRITIDLPDAGLPRGRQVIDLRGAEGTGHLMAGPERVGLVGASGVGKTTLVERHLPRALVRAAYLPQRIDLEEERTVLGIARDAAPGVPVADLRNRLARLRIRGAMVDRPVRTLSGGERLRVAFARLLLADPPPQLVVLDEPTNDLDMESVDALVEALAAYRGALLVVSHDRDFLGRIGLDVVLRLTSDGRLAELRPPAVR